MRKKLFILFLISVSLISLVSANTVFEIEQINKFPGQVQDGGRQIIIIQIEDTRTNKYYIPQDDHDLKYNYNGALETLKYIDNSEGFFYLDIEEAYKDQDRNIGIYDGTVELKRIQLFPEELEDTVTENLEHRFKLEDPDSEGNLIDNNVLSADGIRHIEDGASQISGGNNVEIDINDLGLDYGTGNEGELTISGWIYPSGENGIIFGKTYFDTEEETATGYHLYQDDGTIQFRLYSEKDDDSSDQMIELSNSNLQQDLWNFVAVSLRRENGEINVKLTVNRYMGEPSTIEGSFEADYEEIKSNSQIGTDDSYKDFLEAVSDFDPDEDNSKDFSGRINEFRFYSTALEEEEIDELIYSGTERFYDAEITDYKEYFHENYEEIEDMEGEYEFKGDITSLDKEVSTDNKRFSFFSYDHKWESTEDKSSNVFEVPNRDETLYIAQLYAIDHEDRYHNSLVSDHGAAMPIEVDRNIEGNFYSFEHDEDHCNEDVTSCEKGAEITFWIEELQNKADNVEVNVTAINDEDETTKIGLLDERGVYQEDNMWKGEFYIPEYVNANEIEVEAKLIETYSTDTVSGNLELDPFRINLDHMDLIYQSRKINIGIQTLKYYTTDQNYPMENISEIILDFKDIDEEVVFDEDDIKEKAFLDDDFLNYKHLIPIDADTGTHELSASIVDMSGATYEASSSFEVLELTRESSDIRVEDASSSLGSYEDGQISKTMSDPEKLKGNIVLANYGDINGYVEVSFEGDLEDIGSTDQETYKIPNSGKNEKILNTDIEVVLNFSEKEPDQIYEGGIVFNVEDDIGTNYSTKIDTVHYIETPCEFEEGALCIRNKTIEEEITSVNDSLTLEILNQGDEDLDIEYGPSFQDELFNVFRSVEKTIEGGETYIDLELRDDLNAENNGDYKGNISFDFNNSTLNMPASINISIPQGELELSVDETDLGDILEGDSVDISYEIENTGDVDFSYVNIRSDPTGISDSTDPVSSGDSISDEFEFNTYLFGTGEKEITIEAVSNSSARDSETLSVFILENIEDNIENLENLLDDYNEQIMDLPEEADTTEINNEFENLRNDIDQLNEYWEENDYSSAKDLYNDIDFSILESLISDAEDVEEDEDNDEDEPEIPENGEIEEEGPSVLLFIIPVIILVIIGAIVYLSIVPEE